jgi:hypothetical protein
MRAGIREGTELLYQAASLSLPYSSFHIARIYCSKITAEVCGVPKGGGGGGLVLGQNVKIYSP